ncbi:hypothetical protein MLD38_030669 [Melastoma candidum]|uniref:Uncharacterized protein n=1 Tax=Melastoma candidum TaxID=119954 RepID=A0ACB9MM20_9MYRT|nr:hypothetical protein MLD38_030669 [Melastoma candidum]
MSVLSPVPHPHRILLPPSTWISPTSSLLLLRPPPSHPTFLRRPSSPSCSGTRRSLAATRVLPTGNEGNRRPEGIGSSAARVRDSVQIFLAVLFWLSLFFWSCAWDGRDRPSKGSQWRR